mgnify:CR=1 FL=1
MFGIQLKNPDEFILEFVMLLLRELLTEWMGFIKPIEVTLKVACVPTCTVELGKGPWMALEVLLGWFEETVIVVCALALRPELSVTETVITCVPVSCTCGVQLKFPEELMKLDRTVDPPKLSLTV